MSNPMQKKTGNRWLAVVFILGMVVGILQTMAAVKYAAIGAANSSVGGRVVYKPAPCPNQKSHGHELPISERSSAHDLPVKSKKKAHVAEEHVAHHEEEHGHASDDEGHNHHENADGGEHHDGDGHDGAAGLPSPRFNLFPGTLEEQEHTDSLDKVVEYMKDRAHNGTLMLIPTNVGYVNFALNLMCSLLKIHPKALLSRDATRRGFVFIALDSGAHKMLAEMNLPVVKDPEVPFVSSKSAAWGDPKFHSLVCTKLITVVRALRAGLRVILSDADITFRKDLTPFLREDVSVTFSIGSCHKDIQDNFHISDGSVEKLNTGFYYAHPSKQLVKMMSTALNTCRTSHLTGDQPAINSAINNDWSNGKFKQLGKKKVIPIPVDHEGDDEDDRSQSAVPYTYGFFDGCLFANGCIYFKHLCANTTYSKKQRQLAAKPIGNPRSGGLLSYEDEALVEAYPRNDPVMVHANFLVGKKDKIKHLRRYELWDEGCIAHWRGDVTDAPMGDDKPAGGSKGASKRH